MTKKKLSKSGDDDKTGEHMRTVTGTVKGKNVLLQTATVMAYNENSGKSVPVHILLDCGSQRSYVTNCLKSELDLKAVKTKNVHLNTFGDDKFKKQKCDIVNLKLKGRYNGYHNEIEINALCFPTICSPLPASKNISKYPHLSNLELADEY